MPVKSRYLQYLISHPDYRCVAFFQNVFLCNQNFADAKHCAAREASHIPFEFFTATKFIRTTQGGMMYFVAYDQDTSLSRYKGIEIDAFITDELHIEDRLKVHDILQCRVRRRSK